MEPGLYPLNNCIQCKMGQPGPRKPFCSIKQEARTRIFRKGVMLRHTFGHKLLIATSKINYYRIAELLIILYIFFKITSHESTISYIH